MSVCHVGMTKVHSSTIVPCAQPHLMLQFKYLLKLSITNHVLFRIFSKLCKLELIRPVKASYHVGLIQSLLPVVQLFLKESLLLAEQLLQQYTEIYDED